jgi:hypothetical protein
MRGGSGWISRAQAVKPIVVTAQPDRAVEQDDAAGVRHSPQAHRLTVEHDVLRVRAGGSTQEPQGQ